MSRGSHVPTSRVTACIRAPSGERAAPVLAWALHRRCCPAAPRPARRRRARDRAASRIRGRRSAAARATGRPARRSRPSGRQVRTQMRARAGSDVQRRRPSPRQATSLVPATVRRTGSVADGIAGRERDTSCRSAALRSRSAASMTAGDGVSVRRALAGPRRCAEAAGTASSSTTRRPRSVNLLIAAPPFARSASRRSSAERPWFGTVCRSWPRDAEALEQPVGRGPAGGRGAFHQRHRQVDADAVTGQHQAVVRGGHAGAVGEVAWREPRTVVVAQHLLADDPARRAVSGIQLVQAVQQSVAQIVVGCVVTA